MAERATFYYDLSSPYAYLAAERISGVFSEAAAEQPVWQPISFPFLLRESGRVPWSLKPGGANADDLAEIQRRAAERGLPRVVYPEGWPAESYSLAAIRAAVYAKQAGRVVSYSLAAFRQAFAGGRRLDHLDNVVIAAAACELHPNAVLKGIETESVKEKLKQATDEAIALGVVGIPTVAVGGELFWGDDHLEKAAAAAAR
ncbi:MAG: 2-hydroxychromene-2-carboxylate isomerase [Solirubrobacterales bacterium]